MRHLLLACIAGAARGTKLGIDFSTDEAFSITIDGVAWLHGGGASLPRVSPCLISRRRVDLDHFKGGGF